MSTPFVLEFSSLLEKERAGADFFFNYQQKEGVQCQLL